MVHIVKVYFEDQNKEKQIRRIAVNSDIVGKFDLLVRKIREIFPMLENKKFEVTWKDPENDVIHMSSDDELAQALANAEDGLLRIYVNVVTENGKPIKAEYTSIPKAKSSHNDMHPNVVCDGCDKNISGYRYKCLQCRNYDLCSACNNDDKHPNHDMIKLVKPVHISREWVFLGARKIWRSMFGRCPASYFAAHHNPHGGCNGPHSPQAEKPEGAKPQWHTVVDDLLKGDFVPAEKLLKENLGNFLNFVESVAGGVDVKIDNPPFAAGPCPMRSQATDENSNKVPEKHAASPQESTTAATPENPTVLSEKVVEKEPVKIPESPVNNNNNNSAASNTEELVHLETSMPSLNKAAESKVSMPVGGLFSQIDTSVNADGWTLLDGHDVDKKESLVATSSMETGAKPKATQIYPDLGETVQPAQAPMVEQCSAKVEVEETKPKETLPMTQDPKILNALYKMQAMGFTNEGGWLERLLITKDGNINEALDSLYPNSRRR